MRTDGPSSLLASSSYVAGNPESPVAVCTLSSHNLLDGLSASAVGRQVAIMGPLETENIGIERMVATLLEQPRIRWLILCGDERRGRYQAQALRCLFTSGIDTQGAIAGARSKRARLPTLTAEHVNAVRQQVSLYDLVGVHDVAAISEAVASCLANDPGPFAHQVSLPQPEPIVVPARPYRLRQHDPNGFFVILLDRARTELLVEHYANDGRLLHRIVGTDAESLCSALVDWNLVSRLDHAAYLGRELAKAELAVRRGLPYQQDDPL